MFAALKRWFTRSGLPLRGEREWLLDAWDGLLHSRTESGYRVTPLRALGHAPFWRGINILSNMPTRTALHVYRDTPEHSHVRATNHSAYRLLRRRPNRWMSAATFKRTLTFHRLLYGNGFARIFRDGRGEPASLVPLDPSITKPEQAQGALWYKINETDRLIADDVLHIKGLSHDGIEGLGVIHLLADALGLGLSARQFAARFFAQGAQAAGVLGVDGLDPEATAVNGG